VNSSLTCLKIAMPWKDLGQIKYECSRIAKPPRRQTLSSPTKAAGVGAPWPDCSI